MSKYTDELRKQIVELRISGHTYPEIQRTVGQTIPKGTLSYICRDVAISKKGKRRIDSIIKANQKNARIKAVAANRAILQKRIMSYKIRNRHLTSFMRHRESKMIALAMLYLGEGAKWKGRRGLQLASSDPLIIRLYINLLRECYEIDVSQLRFRIQHRADQNPEQLTVFWSSVVGAPYSSFYKSYIDKRTIGKATMKSNYRGVCSVSCPGTSIQLELEQIAGIISEAV